MIHRNLVFWDERTAIVLAFVVVGFIALNVATIGYDGQILTYLGRGLYLGVALLILFGPFAAQLVGGIVIVALLVLPRFEHLPETLWVPLYRS